MQILYILDLACIILWLLLANSSGSRPNFTFTLWLDKKCLKEKTRRFCEEDAYFPINLQLNKLSSKSKKENKQFVFACLSTLYVHDNWKEIENIHIDTVANHDLTKHSKHEINNHSLWCTANQNDARRGIYAFASVFLSLLFIFVIHFTYFLKFPSVYCSSVKHNVADFPSKICNKHWKKIWLRTSIFAEYHKISNDSLISRAVTVEKNRKNATKNSKTRFRP